MTRRTIGLLVTLTPGFLVAPLVAEAQRPANVSRIGYLDGNSPSESAHLVKAFWQGLRALGYVEGQNITITECLSEQITVLKPLSYELVTTNWQLIAEVLGLGRLRRAGPSRRAASVRYAAYATARRRPAGNTGVGQGGNADGLACET